MKLIDHSVALGRPSHAPVLGSVSTRVEETSSRLERSVVALLLAALAFTALAHGAVEAWSLALFQLLVVGIVLIWIAKGIRDGVLKITLPPTALPLVALILLGVAHSISLSGQSGQRVSLSMDVDASRAALAVMLCLLVTFLATATFFTGRQRLWVIANLLILYGLALAVFALIQHFTWDGRFYWLRSTERQWVFGPFTNRNHFAGYMEMLIPIPIGLIVGRTVRRETWAFYGFAAVIMALAVVISLSRGGMISVASGLLFMVLMSFKLRGSLGRRRSVVIATGALIVAGIAAAIVMGIFWLGPDPVAERISPTGDSQAETFYTSRGWIWTDTLRMIQANPISGVGLGAFKTAYPIYESGSGAVAVAQAHNDYLDIIASSGVIGGAIALWFMIAIIRTIKRGVGVRDPLSAGLALGCGAGIFGMLVHSLFDFNLQIPSNAMLFLILSAVVSRISQAVSAPAGDTGVEL